MLIVNFGQVNKSEYVTNPIYISIKSSKTKLGKLLSPTWVMVKNFLTPCIDYTIEEYEDDYESLMVSRVLEIKDELDILVKGYTEITLMCECQRGQFCHRDLAYRVIESYCKMNKIEIKKGDWCH